MASTQWVAASGDWNTAANWSNGVPGASDTAVFNTGSSDDASRHTVSAMGVSVGVLTLEDATLFIGSLTATTATAAGAVRIDGTGTVWTIQDGITETAGELFVIEGAELVAQGSGLVVSSYAQLDLDPRSSILGSLTLLNEATLLAENSSASNIGDVVLSNTLQVTGSGSITTGYVGSTALVGGTLTVAGLVTGNGGLVIGTVQSGYATGNPYGFVAQYSNGTIRLTNSGNTYVGGTLLESGTLVVAAPGAAGNGPIAIPSSLGTLVVASGVGSLPLIQSAGTVVNADAALQVFERNADPATNLFTSRPALTFLNGAGHSTVVGAGSSVGTYGSYVGEPASQTGRTYTILPGQGTVYGGTGAVTVFGGNNVVYGGSSGNNLVVSDVGDTMVGGGSGDLLVGNSGRDIMVAGAGNETLTSAAEPSTVTTSTISGASATGALVFGGSGADLIACGSLYDTVVAGSGATTIFGGAADPNLLYAGSGADVIVTGGRGDFVQLGSGQTTIFAAQGANLITAVDGAAGGAALVVGFKPGLDALALRGYGSGPQAGLASSTVVGGSTVLTLSDSTHVTLQGVSSLGASAFV